MNILYIPPFRENYATPHMNSLIHDSLLICCTGTCKVLNLYIEASSCSGYIQFGALQCIIRWFLYSCFERATDVAEIHGKKATMYDGMVYSPSRKKLRAVAVLNYYSTVLS